MHLLLYTRDANYSIIILTSQLAGLELHRGLARPHLFLPASDLAFTETFLRLHHT
jgi:hypothetical protein